jgi:hypothetical protein
MSLEKIDEYMRQLTAVKNYDKLCEDLEKIRKEWAKSDQTLHCSETFAESLLSKKVEMQKELDEKEETIKLCKVIMGQQQEYITLLESSLEKAQRDPSFLRKILEVIGKQSLYVSKDFASLGIIIDDRRAVFKRKMNAVFLWLLTNGFPLV